MPDQKSLGDRPLPLSGRVAIVTGAGQGIGRFEAIELAAQGARVVVNDLGASVDGTSSGSRRPAEAVVAEIRERGGDAVANHCDVADWSQAESLVAHAVDEFGSLDILLNNAGVLRRGPFLDMEEDDLDALMRVHLKGTVATMHHAGRYWRDMSRSGIPISASVVNTTSRAGLIPEERTLGLYAGVKSGVAMLTMTTAVELAEFGVRVNAIAPRGETRMNAFAAQRDYSEEPRKDTSDAFDARSPANVAPVAAWLASDDSAPLTGQVFSSDGGSIAHFLPWRRGAVAEQERMWRFDEVGPAVRAALAADR